MSTPVKIRPVPATADPAVYGVLTDIVKAVEQIQGNQQPPQPITGLTATSIAGGCVVQFTRSNGTDFRLYIGSSPDQSSAQIVDLGSNNQWTDNVGRGGVKRYYWVQAYSNRSQYPSSTTGPVSATTLALGTSATVTPPVDASQQSAFNTLVNAVQPVVGSSSSTTAPKVGPG